MCKMIKIVLIVGTAGLKLTKNKVIPTKGRHFSEQIHKRKVLTMRRLEMDLWEVKV